ncbi:MAG: hypothetical protein H0W50_07230 [Parachlamydiaceae bacterium]|nr:hypothetical protein [Parachlamydiaceae bacterium]
MQNLNDQCFRCFDLGGGGLKTALVRYDQNTKTMNIEGKAQKLGKCPNDQEVSKWVREKIAEIGNSDLDKEINDGYLFGFCLAGLDKLREKPLDTWDIATLHASKRKNFF